MKLLTLAEIACCLAVAYGVCLMLGLGAALVVGGFIGVLACEWLSAKHAAMKEKPRGDRR